MSELRPNNLTPKDNEAFAQWCRTDYFRQLTEATTRSLNYLHSSINWSLTLVTAGVAFQASARSEFLDRNIVYILPAFIIIITHFFVRSAKGYINIMRYSTIQKMIISYTTYSSFRIDEIRDCVETLDAQWASPIRMGTILYKLMFEFGFLYFYAFIVMFSAIMHPAIDLSCANIVVLTAGVVFAVLEVYFGLYRSPYLSKIKVYDLAQRLR